MNPAPPTRLRPKEKIPRGRVRKFTPRWIPRDKYDARMLLVVYPLLLLAVLPIAWVWMELPGLIVRSVGLGSGVALLVTLFQLSIWIWAAMRALINHLEVADDGLHVSGFRSRTIAWEDIEAVEPLGRGETLRAMLRWPIWEWNLQMSGGLTFGQYVRIRTKSGTLIFGPQNRAEFLDALHTHLHRQNPKVEVPVWMLMETPVTSANVATPATAAKPVEDVQTLGIKR